MPKRLFLATGIGISLFLAWFAVSNYRASRHIAEENLRGLAHSLAAAVENLAARDPSLRSLSEFHPPDIAFFALIDGRGIYRFHTNTDLVGTAGEGGKFVEVLRDRSSVESWITLGTGERAYEFYAPFYFPGETLVLRLTLHTYRADAVVRRAEFNMAVLFALLVTGWVLLAVLYRFSVREERHQREMERRKRLAQLGEMGAMLAHEIRNPLAGIKGYAQVIEKRPGEARNAGFAEGIVREVLRLESLVNDLLAYAGGDASPPAAVDLREAIGWAVSLVRHEAGEQHVSVVSDCREGVRVPGNRDRLGQVLLNLVKNALHAMPDGGSLRIAAEASGKQVTITVSDTGHGIAPGDMGRIFEPFFTTKARGTGLGLPLCRKIIEEWGGTIRVESTPARGTTVSIVLPGITKRSSGGSYP
ncbi:ATP-binding protein [Geobacter sp.]|uniref:two-component system sensor histidine kinase NtrB n=1 Tax=Geobacter sp. TaxID=46610 RepID=UPI002609889E|nr:ATP-binding protein [Geobacter sp.]